MPCFPIQSLNTFLSSCYLGRRCCTVWLAHSCLLAAQVVDLELEAQAEAPCQFRPFSICPDSDFHEFYRNFNFLTLLLGLVSIDHCNKNYFWGIGGQAVWPLPVCAYESSHLMGCIWIQDKSKSHSCPVLAVLNPSWWFYPKKTCQNIQIIYWIIGIMSQRKQLKEWQLWVVFSIARYIDSDTGTYIVDISE